MKPFILKVVVDINATDIDEARVFVKHAFNQMRDCLKIDRYGIGTDEVKFISWDLYPYKSSLKEESEELDRLMEKIKEQQTAGRKKWSLFGKKEKI